MSENKKSWLKSFLWWAITSPVTLCFIALMLWFAVKVYVLDIEPWRNKIALFVIFSLWILWLIFKNLVRFLLFLAVMLAVFYGFYYYSNQDKIDCEKAGNIWNEEKQICEMPKTFWKSLKNWWNKN